MYHVRKRLLMILCCLGLLTFQVIPVDAQSNQQDVTIPERSTALIHWGFKAGTTLSQFNQSGLTIGFDGGVVLKSDISRIFGIQAEFLYIMEGSSRGDYTLSVSNIGGNVAYQTFTNRAVSLQCASLPILGIIHLGSVEGNIRPKVMIGASYSYCFAAFERFDEHLVFTDGTEAVAGNQVENVLSDYRNNQIDGIGGFGIDYDLTDGHIFGFEVRYHQGLNDINLFKSPRIGGAIFKNTICINFSYLF